MYTRKRVVWNDYKVFDWYLHSSVSCPGSNTLITDVGELTVTEKAFESCRNIAKSFPTYQVYTNSWKTTFAVAFLLPPQGHTSTLRRQHRPFYHYKKLLWESISNFESNAQIVCKKDLLRLARRLTRLHHKEKTTKVSSGDFA